MTKEELDEKILNRTPRSGFHLYDGFLFLSTLLTHRKSKRGERVEKLRIIDEPEFDQNAESSKYEENLHIV